jgi:hypothetical protein
MSDQVLTYLQGDSQGAKRDMIARCYYEVAQGDPKSGPVAFAVLLNASAEQFAKTPEELYAVITQLQKVVTNAADLERRLVERQDQQNTAVVAGFKDETRRAIDTLREIVGLANITLDRAKQIDETLKPIRLTLERISHDLYLLQFELREYRESAQRTEASALKIEVMHQENHALMLRSSKEARANWITIGLLAGILLAALVSQLLWWEALLVLAAIIGLIQGLSRVDWKFGRKQAPKVSPPVESKPTD